MVNERIKKVEPTAVESLAALVVQMESLKDDVDEYNRQRRRDFLISLCAILVVAFFVAGGFLLVRQINALAFNIADCTQTSGKCYQSASRRTGGAIQYLTDVQRRQIIAANWCSRRGIKTLDAYRKCVDDTVTALAKSDAAKGQN